MQITISDDAGTTGKASLAGRLDIMGADAIALPLSTLAGAKSNLIVDLSGVTFLASIGIRHLVMATKAVSRRGGRLVLLSPNDAVKEVLETSGVTDLMPVASSESEALALIG